MRVVWYHGNCWDGFGAAYALWCKFGDHDTTYTAVNYGTAPPAIPPGARELWLVDFTYPIDDLWMLRKRFDRMCIIDHHKTAEQTLTLMHREGFCCDVKIYDMEHSGAYLTYRHVNPDVAPKNVPLLYDYLQDRDLWRFELPESQAVNAYIKTVPYEFEAFAALQLKLQADFNRTVSEGKAILRLIDRTVEMMCEQAHTQVIDGYQVPTVNAAAFWSEMGHALLDRYPDASFVCTYFDRADGQRVYSLRSRDDFDCSAVAKRMGGGGHNSAAGFTCEIDQPPTAR